MNKEDITGVMVQYYMVCKRELWFYIKQINMNYNNDDILIGRFLHENSYKRENKEIRIDNIVFDFVKKGDELVIFEIKKSSKLTIGARYQLYFYLYNLRLLKSDVKGVLLYPKERKKEEIILTDEIIEEMDNIINGILEVSNLMTPPPAKNKPFCKGCSFYELCMV